MKKYALEWTVFICGAVVMILELVGSRILAPYVGTSIVVWTSLIGVILGSLSAGYYWGGRRADQNAQREELAQIILLAAICIVATAILKEPILNVISKVIKNLYIATVTSTLLLFAPASAILGMISPYAAKLKMYDTEHAGKTIGTLYALSTLGSIVGTFLAGFLLIAFFGSTNILYVLAGTLILATIILQRDKIRIKLIMLVVIGVIAALGFFSQAKAESKGMIDVDTNYQRIQIYPIQYKDRLVRILRMDKYGLQSGMLLDGDVTELVFDYLKMYNMVEQFVSPPKHALMIGGAAYSYPKAFLKKFPEADLDVVEFDPALTALARKYFFLTDDPRLHIFHEDGRTFLNKAPSTMYDAIFVDAFTSLTPPYQLTTREAVQKMSDRLQEDGVVFVNLIGAFEGDASPFFQAEYATYKSVFPNVYAFWVNEDDATKKQNLMIVAAKSAEPMEQVPANEEIAQYLKQRWQKDITTDMPILTDEYAPIERYMMRVY